jgi:hypothetical protein
MMIGQVERAMVRNAMKDGEKDMAIVAVLQGGDGDRVVRLIAALKVLLLPDYDMPGHQGLSEENRALAWGMVRDLGNLLVKGKSS